MIHIFRILILFTALAEVPVELFLLGFKVRVSS